MGLRIDRVGIKADILVKCPPNNPLFLTVTRGTPAQQACPGIQAGSRVWPLSRQPFLLETSRPGIFAAGDVRLGSTKRVASAVSEGAMAVQFVHQYLTTS